MTDQQLLTLYAARDPGATAAMQAEYGSYCAAIAGRILTDPRDAEECLNDLWMRVWVALEYQRPEHLKGWLGAAARNCAIDRFRRQNRAETPLEESAAELARDLRDTPAEVLESRALGEAISAFLRLQSQHDRVAFIRRYWYGDSIQQVAAHMGWSTAKTKTVLFRLRNKLRHHLMKEGYYGE